VKRKKRTVRATNKERFLPKSPEERKTADVVPPKPRQKREEARPRPKRRNRTSSRTGKGDAVRVFLH